MGVLWKGPVDIDNRLSIVIKIKEGEFVQNFVNKWEVQLNMTPQYHAILLCPHDV